MNERDVFIAAMQLDDDAERTSYLDDACAGDVKLRHRVDALLQAFGQAGRFLQQPAAGPATMDVPVLEAPGTVIGPYKLLEQIGEGGFGVVFLAEQERPVRRKVALKVIKPGMDTRQVIARFEAERQALAMMDHPNIAKVLDAGTTDSPPLPLGEGRGEGALLHAPYSPLAAPSGRPYFVMELVQGIPITEYCDQCNLTTRERLELFITVCQAVQHAHQKGVIHRDIKPTNVLVAMQDGKPAPKIIDFGVAKAIGEQPLTERTLTTAFAQMVGTPMYMSPEQAELSPLGVDTRSDIYSLGVLLYELLTGSTPFDKDRLHSANYDELRRIIREEEPPRPSARLHSLFGSLPLAGRAGEGVAAAETARLATTIAVRRRTDPRRLVQTVRGELDWIVMKCLEKDRNRRYETPNSLARDIECYLDDEPVQACPPSASYRFRKFARRNKTMLAAGGAIAAALVMGLGLAAWQYLRATTENARAQAVSNLLQAILASSNPDQTNGSQYSLRELSDEFAAGLGDQLADYHFRLGELLTRQSRTVLSPDDAQRLAKDVALRAEEAHRHIRQAIEAHSRVAIDYPDDFERRANATVGFTEIIKVCVVTPGFDNEVDELNRRLKAELPALLAAFPDSNDCQWRSAMTYLRWGNALAPSGTYLSTAEHALSQSIEILEKLSLADPKRPRIWLYLADLYIVLGDVQWARPEESAADFRRVKEIYDQHAAEIAADATPQDAVGICAHYVRLAYFLACSNRQEEAAELLRQAAVLAGRITDPVVSNSGLCTGALVQLRLGDVAGYRESCRELADVPVADADDLTKVRLINTWCCGPDALEDMSLVVTLAEQLVADNSHGQRHVILYVSGAALYRAGQYDRAADRLEESIAAYPTNPAPAHAVINFQRLFLAMTKWKQGKRDEARRLIAETLPALDKELQSSSWWSYRLGLEVLRDEAVALIEPKEPDEAVEKNTVTPTTTED